MKRPVQKKNSLNKNQNSLSILSTCYDLIETVKVFGAYGQCFDGFHILGLSRGGTAAHFLTFGDIVRHFMEDEDIKRIRSLTLVGSVPVIQMMDKYYQKPPFPITYIHGDDDLYVRPKATQHYAKRIGATWIEIKNGGHGLWRNEDKEKRIEDAEDWSKFAWILDRPWKDFKAKNPKELKFLMENLSSNDACFYASGDSSYPGDKALEEKRQFEKTYGGRLLPRYTELGDFRNPYGIFRLSVGRGVTMKSSKEGYALFIEKLLDVLKKN